MEDAADVRRRHEVEGPEACRGQEAKETGREDEGFFRDFHLSAGVAKAVTPEILTQLSRNLGEKL